MIIYPAFAVPLLLIGWFGFSIRRTGVGAAVSLLILWQGIIAFAAIYVFQQETIKEGSVLIWILSFMCCPLLMTLLVLSLRQYYSKRSINWEENEEIRR